MAIVMISSGAMANIVEYEIGAARWGALSAFQASAVSLNIAKSTRFGMVPLYPSESGILHERARLSPRLGFAASNGVQRMIRVVVELLRLLAATTPTMTTSTTTPRMIQIHGTVFVVVVVVVEVEESPVVVFGAVAEEPPAAGPVVVDVVLELPAAPAVCANAITGAVASSRAMSMRLSRRIGRM
jgi:hypothetical protein